MNKTKRTKIVGYFEEGAYTIWHIISRNFISGGLFTLAALFAIYVAANKLDTWFDHWINPIAGIMTLLVTIGLSLQNHNRNWKNKLYKTLTVHYKYKNKYVLSCFFTDLTSDGDIRNWGQQIGQQMTGALLDFEAFFDIEDPKILKLPSNGKTVLHHEIFFSLKSDKNLRNGQEAFNADEHIRWYITHSKDHDSHSKIELEIISPRSSVVEPEYIEQN